MFRFSKLVLPAALLGVIDQIHEGSVLVELNNPDGVIENFQMPVSVFPCEISEGDVFYINHIDGVTEIRCGEPPL